MHKGFNDEMVAALHLRVAEEHEESPCHGVGNELLAQKAAERAIRSQVRDAVSRGKHYTVILPLCLIDTPEGIIDKDLSRGEVMTSRSVERDHLLCRVHQIFWDAAVDLGLLVYVGMHKLDGMLYLYAAIVNRNDPEQMGEIGEGYSGFRR